jgi:predicted alpha/beta-hydrolase family hydrolase
VESRDIDTPHGPARAHLRPAADARALLVLGHGAGGSIGARDLQVVAAQAGRLGVGVALVEQPYRVAGRRSAAPAHQLDAAWLAVLARLRAQAPAGLPVIAGGRSSGARVACRTAAAAGALGVLCLAFPLLPPGRAGRDGAPPAPRPSRQPELDAVAAPVLIVQGERDPFGMPAPGPARTVAQVPGDHRLTADLGAVGAAAAAWLAGLLADAP